MEKLTPTPAMILPFPSDGRSDVELVDLSGTKKLFSNLGSCFASFRPPAAKGCSKGLPVVRIGAYDVSVAKSLQELKELDTSVFVLAPSVDVLLLKHYSAGFGFIIAKFHAGVDERHPLAYIHSLANECLFVPTRHQHGEELEVVSRWDHDIYSYARCDSTEAGEDASERAHRLRDTKTQYQSIQKPKKTVKAVLNKLPVKLDHSNDPKLRVLHIKGELPNRDVTLQII